MVDVIFNTTKSTTLRETIASFVPQFQITETSEHFVLSAAVPDANDEDVTVALNGNRLAISAKRDVQSFTCTFTLRDADGDGMKADLTDGRLIIVVPKKAKK